MTITYEVIERRYGLGALDGPPVLVFVHGNGFCRQIWYGVIGELERRRRPFRAVLCDLTGHGMSPEYSAEPSWRGHGEDVQALVEALKCQTRWPGPWIAVGHSLGATALLLSQLQNPSLFDAAVVAEPVTIPVTTQEGKSPYLDKTRVRRHRWESIAAAEAHFGAVYKTWDPRAVRGYLQGALGTRPDGSLGLRCSREDEAKVYELSMKNGLFERTEALTLPIIALLGERGRPSSAFTHIVDAIGRLKNSSATDVPGAGHNVPMENPAAVAQVIESVVAGAAGGSDRLAKRSNL